MKRTLGLCTRWSPSICRGGPLRRMNRKLLLYSRSESISTIEDRIFRSIYSKYSSSMVDLTIARCLWVCVCVYDLTFSFGFVVLQLQLPAYDDNTKWINRLRGTYCCCQRWSSSSVQCPPSKRQERIATLRQFQKWTSTVSCARRHLHPRRSHRLLRNLVRKMQIFSWLQRRINKQQRIMVGWAEGQS